MSQQPSTNNKNEQKAASPGAETQVQAEIRALKARLAEFEAAAAATAAASEAKLSAESAPKPGEEPGVKPAPKPASSSTPAALAINESGYYESGQYPPPDSKLHPPQQRERLQKSAPRAPQPKKPSTQGPAAKEREKKVKEQKELGNTERRGSLGGYEVSSSAEGLTASKHAPGKTAPRQSSQPRGQGQEKRGGGQARGGAAVKKEEGEMQGHQIRGASQRGRAGMLPPSRPPPRQTSIPAPSPPQQQPCHMPYCQGTFGPGVRFCPLCGTPRQERQGPSMHGAQPPPYQQWGSSAFNPYASTPLAFYGSSPAPVAQPYSSYSQYPGQPPFNYPSWWAPPPSPFSFPGYTAPSPARDSATPAPPARSPSQGVKRERSPSDSLHGESQPAQLSKRAMKKIRKAEFRSASTVLPSIETPPPQQTPRQPQPSRPRQTPQLPQQPLLYTSRKWSAPTASSSNSPDVAQIRQSGDAVLKQYEVEIARAAAALAQRQAQAAPSRSMPSSTNVTASPSVTEVAQQLPTSEPEKSNEKAEQPADSAPEDGQKKVEQAPADSASENEEKMDFTAAPSNDELAVPPPPQSSDVADLAARRNIFNRLEQLGRSNSDWSAAARHNLQIHTEANLAQVRSQVATVAQHHGFAPSNFDSLLRLHEEHHAEMLLLIENCTHRRARPVNAAFTLIDTASVSQLEGLCLSIGQRDGREIAEYVRASNVIEMRYHLRFSSSELPKLLEEAFQQCSAAPRSPPAPPSAPLPAISQRPAPSMLPAPSHSSEQPTALIPREGRAIVPVDESSHRIDELEDDGENVRMEDGEATSASPSGNTSLVRRRIEGRPPHVGHEEKRLQRMGKKYQ